jgi:mRNA-degrading endonuclease RelE of RelBE toxin-antitoxin system
VTYRVEVTPEFERDLARLDQQARGRILTGWRRREFDVLISTNEEAYPWDTRVDSPSGAGYVSVG